MVDGVVRIKGLDAAMAAMRAAFPKNPEQQRRLLNQTMSGAARKSIIPVAKQLARQGDGSGALSEAIAPRAVRRSKANAAGATARVDITPVRSNRKAMAMYINHYYTRLGKIAPAKVLTRGIHYGHWVEFGRRHQGVSGRPFLWPAAVSERGKYISVFAKILKKKVEAAVRRKAKKRLKK